MPIMRIRLVHIIDNLYKEFHIQKPIGFMSPIHPSTHLSSLIPTNFVYRGHAATLCKMAFAALIAIVCTLTKQAHFIPCIRIHAEAPQFARLFMDNLFRHNGFCSAARISNYDPRFHPVLAKYVPLVPLVTY